MIEHPGLWQHFIKRPDNKSLSIMDARAKYLQEQFLHENYVIAQQQNLFNQSVSSGASGTNSTPPPSYTITFNIEVENDGNYFRFGVDATEGASTNVTINWGDGSPIESGSVTFPTGENFQYNYPTAGTYTVGVIFSEPSNVSAVYADQND